ncbi:hypothetical protein ACPA9J_11280 [Pseudomonas aeruginosa]
MVEASRAPEELDDQGAERALGEAPGCCAVRLLEPDAFLFAKVV